MKNKNTKFVLLLSLILSGCNFSQSNNSSWFDPWDNLNGGGIASTGEVEDDSLEDYIPGDDGVIEEDQLVTDDSNAIAINFDNLSNLPSGLNYNEDQLVITKGGIYSFTGNFNGSIIVEQCNDETVQIILDNANIQTKQYSKLSAILFKKTDGLRILTAKDGTTNQICDNEGNYGDDAEEAVIVSKKSSLTINGKGNLNVIGCEKNSSGIKVKKELTVIDTNLRVDAKNNGIKADDFIHFSHANIQVGAFNDGIKTDKEPETIEEAIEYSSNRNYGYILIESTSINVSANDDGIAANNALYIANYQDELISITTNNGAPDNITEASSDNADGKGLKVGGITYVDENGVETDYPATYEENYSLVITGGKININSNDDAISSKGNLLITGGEFEISTGDDGIHAEYLTSIKGGNIRVNRSYEGIEGAAVEIYDGNIYVNSVDDGINAANGDLRNYDYHIYIGGGNIIVDAEGDGVDSNGWMKMGAGSLIVYGPTRGMNGSLDSDKGIVVTGGDLIAFGSNGMVENPASNSTQCYVNINLSSIQNVPTSVSVLDSQNNTLLDVTPTKQYQSVIISLDEFEMSSTYQIIIGSQTFNATLSKIGTALGTNSSGGGNQGGGRPPRPW